MTAGGACVVFWSASLLACGGAAAPRPVPAAPGAPITAVLVGDGYTCFQPAVGLSVCEASAARCAEKQAERPGAAACERVGTVWCHATELQAGEVAQDRTCRRLESECDTSKRSDTSCVQEHETPQQQLDRLARERDARGPMLKP